MDIAIKASVQAIAKRINEREEIIQQASQGAVDKANQVIAEIILQGKDLLEAKSIIPRQDWLPWLTVQCTRTVKRADKYMSIAAHPGKYEEFQADLPLQLYLRMLTPIKEHEIAGPRSWPIYINCERWYAKFADGLKEMPVSQWPAANREKLKEDLQPLATQLWPERFA